MTFEKALEFIINNGVTAYELWIFNKKEGSESGFRKVLKNEVLKPQRKTRELVIAYSQYLQNKNLDSIDLYIRKGKEVVNVIEIEEFVLANRDNFFERERMSKCISKLVADKLKVIAKDPKLLKEFLSKN